MKISARIDDATLHVAGPARVLFRLALPGDVVGCGGKVLTLVSLEDVYMEMEFFLSASAAPCVVIGDEARIMPNLSVPARVIAANGELPDWLAGLTPPLIGEDVIATATATAAPTPDVATP